MSDNKTQQMERITNMTRLLEKQTGKAVRPYRADGYMNLMNRYGTSKDTTEHYKFVPELAIPDESLTLFYEGNGLFAKIIDAPAEEAVKHGFELEDLADEEMESFYQEALDELDWEETVMTAIKWARLFGGSIAVMLINDGGGLEDPLDWKNIKSIDDIRIYDRSVINPEYSTMYSYDPREPFGSRGSRLGMPEYFHINSRFGSFTVHESRCLVFQNGILPENSSNTIYQMWGVPEYIRIHRALRDAEIAHGSAPKMLDRSVQPIYKMKDLSTLLATEQGESLVLKRLQVIDLARGLLNSLVIDNEGEEYDFRTFQFSGVSDVIDATCNLLSALTYVPQSILFGRSPTGMSDTGKADLENWYSYVQRIQKRMIRSNLRYLLSIIFQAGVATGEVDEVPKIKIKFNPLWSLSDLEQADLDLKKAQIDQTKAQTVQLYVDMQVIDPSEVRRKLADSNEFMIETILDEYEDEDELLAAYLGEEDSPNQYGAEADIQKHETDPGTEGSAPANAPAATKLPQDMSVEESAKLAETKEKKKGNPIINQDENFGSVGVLVVSDGKVLTGTRQNDFGYGLVCGPGGHIEKGETPEQAAFRETEEEFGISPKSLIGLGRGPGEYETGFGPHLFLCTDYEGEPNCVDLEMTGAKFRTLEELDQLAASLFQPFADGLDILKTCIETCLFYDNEGNEMREYLVEKLSEAATAETEKEDGGKGSGNHGHKGVSGQLGGSAPQNGGGTHISKTTFSNIRKKLLNGSTDEEKAISPFKQLTKEEFETVKSVSKGNKKPKKQSVTILLEDLYSTQPTNKMDRLEKVYEHFKDDPEALYENIERPVGFMETPNRGISVYKVNGKNVIADGNHRLAIMHALDCTSATVDLYDYDNDSNGDGGPGSGNHGHKGVPGQVGGSAPKKGSSKKSKSKALSKKKSVKPHKAKIDELNICPKGTKFNFKGEEWEKIEFDGEILFYCNSDFKEPLDTEDFYNKTIADGVTIEVPDSERFSDERKSDAFSAKSAEEADDVFRKETQRIWNSLNEIEQLQLYSYTASSFGEINSFLRGNDIDYGYEEYETFSEDRLALLTDTVSRSTLKQDTYLHRGVSRSAVEKLLGIDVDSLETEDLDDFVGKIVKDDGFMSCGSAEGTGFTDKPVMMKIYCPKGTQALYAEPFSIINPEIGDGELWDGVSKQTEFSDEAETILQRGTRMQISKFSKQGNKYLLEVDVFSQNPTEINSDEFGNDGGNGSGNWGHEGRPGKLGGSAEGGGSHNRMGDKKSGYTSFSKNKKKFATPHALDYNEVFAAPEHTKFIANGLSFTKRKDSFSGEYFVNDDTGEFIDEYEFGMTVSGMQVSVIIPDSANPNYRKRYAKQTGAFSPERKSNAFSAKNAQEADDMFREKSGQVWRELDETDKKVIVGYTYSQYVPMNRLLRKGSEGIPGYDEDEVRSKVDSLTRTLDKCTFEQDTYLYRGIKFDTAERMLGLPSGALFDIKPEKLVGQTFVDDGFMSCGSSEGTGFTSKDVQLKIYCPAGTKGMYVEPFAYYGNGAGSKWNGVDKQKTFSGELETILQRRTESQITSFSFDGDKYHLEVQVISQYSPETEE